VLRGAVELLAHGARVTANQLPAISTFFPDVHDIEVAAPVAPPEGGLLIQQQTNDREVLAEPAGGVVVLLEGLDLVGARRLSPEAAGQAALGGVRHALHELRAHEPLHGLRVLKPVQGGLAEFQLESAQLLGELRIDIRRWGQLALLLDAALPSGGSGLLRGRAGAGLGSGGCRGGEDGEKENTPHGDCDVVKNYVGIVRDLLHARMGMGPTSIRPQNSAIKDR
jgi:hypothetical protein